MDDLISRQVVAKFLSDWLSCLDENCHKQSASDLKMIIKDFKNLPFIQPERKTGRWIVWYECPNCGEERGYAFDICPMCGAKMKAGEQE